jgi:tRNA(Ile)-lysidine synthase
MSILEQKMRSSLRRLGVDRTSSVVAAVSGGADSTALLDALVRQRTKRGVPASIVVAHFNHLLRGAESDGDEAFVQALAKRLQVPLVTGRGDVAAVARAGKKNLESTARRLRYNFLMATARDCGATSVLTAHNLDDQVETFLMRLLRGSGPDGLRGIHPEVDLGNGVTLIRPLLAVTRAEVLDYCAHFDLEFRTDSSNALTDFTRNRVRLELVPLLRAFNPRFDEAVARAATLLAEDEEFLRRQAEAIIGESSGGRMEAARLNTAPKALRRRAIRLWLGRARRTLARVEASHLEALEGLAIGGSGGKVVELPGGWQATLEDGWLVLRTTGTAGVPPALSR